MNKNIAICFLILLSGLATLSWEVLWQLKISSALGVSAWGTALTLAITMGGLGLGSLLAGAWLSKRTEAAPLRYYGILEIIIGLCGILLTPVFHIIETIDTTVYQAAPDFVVLAYALNIIMALGIPACCMGATLPIFGLISRQHKLSLALLYGINTFGAALGCFVAALVWIPALGVQHATWAVAGINILVGLIALQASRQDRPVATILDDNAQAHGNTDMPAAPTLSFNQAKLIACVTGLTIFILEVAWFRALRAAFFSTTGSFAMMLAAVLIALGLAGKAVPLIKRIKSLNIGVILMCAGLYILATTPLFERIDKISPTMGEPFEILSIWFTLSFLLIAPPTFLIGLALPWLLETQSTPRKWSSLYTYNTLAAVLGALAGGWIILPLLGFAKTLWFCSGILALTAFLFLTNKERLAYGTAMFVALCLAVTFESGIGHTRIIGHIERATFTVDKIIAFKDGPDATVSVAEHKTGDRSLAIDGFAASGQYGVGGPRYERYMDWMGHLPMLAHPNPQNALVICFGTGQTANKVREENPAALDIVDINKNIFEFAPYFHLNNGVLDDERVKTIVMDGRAYMRRTHKQYDVITLEPMPPSFAGVNSPYSYEFYKLAAEKLTESGTIAQWLPFHLMGAETSASISKTFQSVFPNSILWLDPLSMTGIPVGSKNPNLPLGREWLGLARNKISRSLSDAEIISNILLNQEQLKSYSAKGQIITDDNQYLAYGEALERSQRSTRVNVEENFKILNETTPRAMAFYKAAVKFADEYVRKNFHIQ